MKQLLNSLLDGQMNRRTWDSMLYSLLYEINSQGKGDAEPSGRAAKEKSSGTAS